MKKASLVAVAVTAAALQSGTARSAEVRVFSSGAMPGLYEEIGPQFEKATGHKLSVQYGLPPELIARIDASEAFDVVVLSIDVEGLIKRGKLAPDSRTVLGRTGIGVAIPQGAPKPDISTVEAFKRTLLDAKAIATSGQGSSGRYTLTLLDRLGIADQVKPKIKSGATGSSAQMVARREVDFAVTGLPPVAGVPGVEWVGWIPNELQSWVLFTAGLNVAAKEPAAGLEFLKFLNTPAVATVFKAKGLDPAS
jgi:molybdate transport system substrate-binding protein